MKTYTIKDFRKEFPTEKSCLDYVFTKKYPSLVDSHYYIEGRKCYADSKGKQIHPIKGTVFEHSSTPLTLWFYAIYLFSASRNGVAAKELQRQLGVTYKCAWRMAKQIRVLMAQNGGTLSGIVEADETYMGGKMRGGKRGLGSENKTAVFGMVERKGKVQAHVIRIKKKNVMPIVKRTIVSGSNVMTDQFKMYRNLPQMGFKHASVNHGAKEYVRGNIHTNTIEGFWSQIKRSIDGTYHSVSKKYLQSYVNEFSFRRNAGLAVFETMMARI